MYLPLESVHDISSGKQLSLFFHLPLHVSGSSERGTWGKSKGTMNSARNCEAC